MTKKTTVFKINHFSNYRNLPDKVFSCTIESSVLKEFLNAIFFNDKSIKVFDLIECSQNSLNEFFFFLIERCFL